MFGTKWINGGSDIADALKIRSEVFFSECGCAADFKTNIPDEACLHLIVFEDGQAVASGRLMVFVRAEEVMYFLDKVAVLKEFRGKGYGDLVIRMLIRKAYNTGGYRQYLYTPPHLRAFFERFDFIPEGDEFVKDGAAFLLMSHEGDVSGMC